MTMDARLGANRNATAGASEGAPPLGLHRHGPLAHCSPPPMRGNFSRDFPAMKQLSDAITILQEIKRACLRNRDYL